MNFILKAILFIAALAGLYTLQIKVISPLVMKVVKSDLLLTDSEDLGDVYAITDNMTDYANMHCSRYISEELADNANPVFSDKPINAWDIGNQTYVINSQIELTGQDGAALFKNYVCRISFTEKSDPANYENWSIYGISGLDL